VKRFVRNYSLGFLFVGLWLTFWAGQWYCEVILDSNGEDASPALQFAAHTLENLESEAWQVGSLIIATTFFYFKGSPESKEPPE
jgi:hypothetical protein